MTAKKGIDMEKKEEKVGVLWSDDEKSQLDAEKSTDVQNDMPVKLTKLDILENKRDKQKKTAEYDDMPMSLENRFTEEAQQDLKEAKLAKRFTIGTTTIVIIGLIALALFVRIATWSIPSVTKIILLLLLLLFFGPFLYFNVKEKQKAKERKRNELYLGKPGKTIDKTYK